MYSFQLYLSGSWTTVKCLFSECSLLARSEDNVRKYIELSGEIMFYGEQYDTLRTLYLAGTNYVQLRLYKFTTLEFSGFLNLRGTWNTKEQICKLKVITNDRYTEILKRYESEYNILSYGLTKHNLDITIDSVEVNRYSVCTTESQTDYKLNTMGFDNPYDSGAYYANNGEITPITAGKKRHVWSYFIFDYSYFAEFISDETTDTPAQYIINNPSQFNTAQYTYNFVRTYTDSCTNHVWRYTKQMFDFNPETIDPAETGWTNEFQNYWSDTQTSIVTLSETIGRWLNLFDVISRLLQQIDGTITTNIANICTYLTNFQYLYIAQKSDIKRNNSTYPANIANITFKRLMEMLKGMFNIDWYIDDTNEFLLKHPSEISFTSDTDLSSNEYNNLRQYSIKESTNIYEERWEFESTPTFDFSTESIFYSSENYEVKKIELKDVNNDVANLISNSTDYSDSGFVFCQADSLGDIVNEIVNRKVLVNGQLSAVYLVENHMKTGDRPYNKDIDGNALTNCLPFNEHIEIEYWLEYFSTIDITKLVETQLTNELSLSGARKKQVEQKLDGSLATIKLEF